MKMVSVERLVPLQFVVTEVIIGLPGERTNSEPLSVMLLH